jgi:hypothetical protein
MAALTFARPPSSLCILRLSAIGDVTHMLPIVATLQQQWPETEITWIIGNKIYYIRQAQRNFRVYDSAAKVVRTAFRPVTDDAGCIARQPDQSVNQV